MIDTWQSEPDTDWSSLYNPSYVLGTVSATDTFAFDSSEVRKLSGQQGDYVRIFHTDGRSVTDYNIVPADRLKDYYYGQNKESFIGFYCAQIGDTVVFNHKFTASDPQYGGTIKIPVYLYADTLVDDSDEVPVNIPQWLVLISSAEYVRNDVTKVQLYPGLIQEANQLMQRMKDDDTGQLDEVYRDWQPLGQTW